MVINVNKKGFMFIETIVMCAVLMVALLLIYNGYAASIAKQKEKLNYNTTAGELKLYHLKKYLMNELGWVCVTKNDCPQVATFLDGTDYKEITNIDDLKKVYDIKKVYIAKGNVKITSESGDFAAYLKDLKNSDSKYRLIAEFYDKDTKKYSYAWIEYPYVEE